MPSLSDNSSYLLLEANEENKELAADSSSPNASAHIPLLVDSNTSSIQTSKPQSIFRNHT